MALTPDELGAAIHDQSDAVLSRRPDPKNWAAKEVICHLRDTEEVFFMRFHAIVENDELKMYFHPDAAERFAGGPAITTGATGARHSRHFGASATRRLSSWAR